MDQAIRDIFSQVERYLSPIVAGRPDTSLSKEENRILALQQINRLNQRIGQIARSSKDDSGEMKILQTCINGLTVAVKTNNIPMIRATIARARSYIQSS